MKSIVLELVCECEGRKPGLHTTVTLVGDYGMIKRDVAKKISNTVSLPIVVHHMDRCDTTFRPPPITSVKSCQTEMKKEVRTL